MWVNLLAGILARPWARRVAGFALVALTLRSAAETGADVCSFTRK